MKAAAVLPYRVPKKLRRKTTLLHTVCGLPAWRSQSSHAYKSPLSSRTLTSDSNQGKQWLPISVTLNNRHSDNNYYDTYFTDWECRLSQRQCRSNGAFPLILIKELGTAYKIANRNPHSLLFQACIVITDLDHV